MAQFDEPTVVNESALPAPIAAAVRYAITLGLGWLVERDILPADSTEGILALGLMAATVLYGLVKTYRTKKTLVAAAKAAPNDQFIVKK